MDEWDELTATHGPAVWRTICRLLGNRTDRDIRIGSARAAVEAAYGRADEVEEPPAEVLRNIAPSEVIEYLNYNTLGLMVGLKGGKVASLCVQRPEPAPATRPATR